MDGGQPLLVYLPIVQNPWALCSLANLWEETMAKKPPLIWRSTLLALALLNGLIATCAIDSTGDEQAEAATSMPLSRATATATATPATHITPTAAGSTAPPSVGAPDKWSLWVDGPHLRGADLHPCRLFTADGCAQPITRQDIQDLRNLGANLINASYPGVFAQGKATIHYPSVVDDAGVKITFDRTWLEENYRPVREFARQHDVPIYVGEFGVLSLFST